MKKMLSRWIVMLVVIIGAVMTSVDAIDWHVYDARSSKYGDFFKASYDVFDSSKVENIQDYQLALESYDTDAESDVNPVVQMIKSDIASQYNILSILGEKGYMALIETINQNYVRMGYDYRDYGTINPETFLWLDGRIMDTSICHPECFDLYEVQVLPDHVGSATVKRVVKFKMSDEGVNRLENEFYYNFKYEEYLETYGDKKYNDLHFSDGLFGELQVSKDGVHEYDSGVYVTPIIERPHVSLTGYMVADVLYVNVNQYGRSAYDRFIPTIIENYAYMLFLMTGDDDVPFRLLKSDYGTLSTEEIQAIADDVSKSNISLDPEVYSNFKTAEEYINYLTQQLMAMDGKTINKKGVLEIENYLLLTISQLEKVEVTVAGNNINIQSANYKALLKEYQAMKSQIETLAESYSVAFGQEFNGALTALDNGTANMATNGVDVALTNLGNYKVLELPNVVVDYSAVAGAKKNTDYSDYLSQLLGSVDVVNERGVLEVENFLEYAIQNLGRATVNTKSNKITLDFSDFQKEVSAHNDFYDANYKILVENGVAVTKNIDKEFTIYLSNVDLKQAIRFEFTSNWALFDTEKINIIIKDNGHQLTITKENLMASLNGNETFVFDISFQDNWVYLTFLDGEYNQLEKTSGKLSIITLADNDLSAVFATIDDSVSNWGGQVSGGLISFDTGFTGIYEVLGNNIYIVDIDGVSDAEKSYIQFMVSKGFFSVDEHENFYPDSTMIRYHFITALTRMLYEQDEKATSSFTDVPETDYFYPIVSAATSKGIVKGFVDNTFRGSNVVTREEVVAFLARTLAEAKGLRYSDNPDGILAIYNDSVSIGDWAKNDIALALEYGLIQATENFNPQEEITRTEAVKHLYTLFSNLYGTNSMQSATYTDQGDLGVYIGVSVAGVLLLLGLLVYFKRKKGNTEEVPTTLNEETVEEEPTEAMERDDEVLELQEKVCANCHATVRGNSKFCSECGTAQ